MSCNHETLTRIVVEGKYVLAHCNGTLKAGNFVTGGVTSAHEIEVFDDVQGLIDRADNLGLQCNDLHYLIGSLEHGGVLPDDHMRYLLDNVWDADIGLQQRMIALGYTKPE